MATTFTDALLTRGRITLRGRMPASSNATFLAELDLDGAAGLAVYKPARGERPLWDFPPGLFTRELAAYLLSEALGWGLVPPTVRREGPYGEGSLQLFVPADFEPHYFTLRHHAALLAPAERVALEGRARALAEDGRFPTDASGVRYPWPLV